MVKLTQLVAFPGLVSYIRKARLEGRVRADTYRALAAPALPKTTEEKSWLPP